MRILVVDDEHGFRLVFSEILGSEGHDVREAGDAAGARAIITEFDADVLVVDWMLRDDTEGPLLARELREARPGLGVVLVTGFLAGELAGHAEALGARVLQKPFSVDDLLAAVAAVAPAAP